MKQQEAQFRRFLVPLDGSHLAESVLPMVEQLASRLHAEVMLLHIIEQRAPAKIHGERHLAVEAEAEVYLNEIAAQLRSVGIEATMHVHGPREGDVARSIVEHAEELSVDLIILCSHGSGGLRELLFGTIAQQVLQRGEQPILLLHPTEAGAAPAFALERILVPVDQTHVQEPALSVAASIARAFEAELCLALVIPTLTTLADERAAAGMLLPTTMKAILELSRQHANEYLDQLVESWRSQGLAVTSEVVRGDTVLAVLDLAECRHVDLVVIASHGRAGIDALFAGSVAPRIVSRIDRPLLLVRVSE